MNEYLKIWGHGEALERCEIFRRAKLIFLDDFDLDEAMEYLIAQDLVIMDTTGWMLTDSGQHLRNKYDTIDWDSLGSKDTLNSSDPKILLNKISSPWQGFRKLIRYYIDCVKYDERPSCNLNVDALNKKFIFPVLPYDWLPKDDLFKRNTIKIQLNNRTSAPFLRNIVGSREEQGLFIGYPVQVFSTRYGSLLTPVCSIPCEVKSNMSHDFQFIPLYDQSDFNGQWLDKGLGKEQRNAILMATIVSSEQDDGNVAYFDLIKALGAISSFLGDKLHSALDPERAEPMLNLSTALPGIYNVAILFIGEKLKYNISLLRELKKISTVPDAELDKTALAYVFRNPTKTIEHNAEIQYPLPFISLNQEQENAISTSLNSSCTQITGPPGTGKSQAVSNLIANLIFYDKSVIFASKNHKAVEAVISRCDQMSDETKLIHCCSSRAGEEFTWVQAIREINNVVNHQGGDNHFRLCKIIADLVKDACKIKEQSVERYNLAEELSIASLEFQQSTEAITEDKLKIIIDVKTFPDQMETKVIKALMPEPGVFDNKKIISRLRQILWRIFKFKKTLIAAGIFHRKAPFLWGVIPVTISPAELISYANQAIVERDEYKKVQDIHKKINACENKSRTITNPETLQQKFAKIQSDLADVAKNALNAMMRERFSKIPSALIGELQNLRPILDAYNSPLLSALNQSNWERQFQDTLAKLIPYYPAWASTLLSLRKALPLAPAIVDYAIIDEASQCEIPPVIPALYRAKRMVIVGDPNQFRPVITLGTKRHQYLKLSTHKLTEIELQKFDYLLINAFDMANQFTSVLLRDHFRCHDVIADYFNTTFYGGSLNVMTDIRRFKLPLHFKPGIVWHDIEGTVSKSSSGPVINEEISKIYNILTEFKEHKFEGTIGVVTPFRAQAIALEEKLSKEFSSQKWNFIANTAHSFQGDERDIIIFSPGYQKNLDENYKWLLCNAENSNLTNVAVSRARALLIIVGNRELCRNSGVKYLHRLALYPEEYSKITKSSPFESIWEERLYQSLDNAGVKTIPQFPLAGRRLDLAIPEHRIDIEVDGEKHHRDESGHRKADDLWRDYTLGLLGWEIMRFWVYELRDNMDGCVEKIRKTLSEADKRKHIAEKKEEQP